MNKMNDGCMWKNFVVTKIDKKHLINVLRAFKDNYIYLQVQNGSRDIIIKDSKTSITIQSS